MGGLLSSEEDEQDNNLRFYSNGMSSKPFPGSKVEEMLQWFGKYNKLERNHNYIQWLFPIPDSSGMNSSAQPLRPHEAKAIVEDDIMSARVLMAYQMMLDFYGMRLVSTNTGEVRRCPENCADRYNHLNRSSHNYRRITRMLLSLGELGYERFQVPWITFLMEESVINHSLPNLNARCMRHWIDAIKDDEEKYQMQRNYRELLAVPKVQKNYTGNSINDTRSTNNDIVDTEQESNCLQSVSENRGTNNDIVDAEQENNALHSVSEHRGTNNGTVDTEQENNDLQSVIENTGTNNHIVDTEQENNDLQSVSENSSDLETQKLKENCRELKGTQELNHSDCRETSVW